MIAPASFALCVFCVGSPQSISEELESTIRMNVVMNRYIGLVACGLLVALTGCEPASSDVKVTGTVVVAGTPVEQGSITFLAEDDTGPTGGGVIKDGKFDALVPPGKKLC